MGLLVVSPAREEKDVQSPSVDVVILHGLNGSATKTWTDPFTKTFWPKDLLSIDLPQARVFTFEYSASAVFGRTTAGIADYAKLLLGSLVDYRQGADETKRPIIFIAHSLGGILVKQALLISQIDQRYMTISECTIGLIFFGTPHRGSNKATYGRIMSKIATTLMNSTSSKLIATLQSNSDDLQRLASDFRALVPRYNIVSFYETKPMGPFKSMIVEKYSAVLDVPEEEQLPVNVNHRDMCKFSSRDDETYQLLWSRLRRIVEISENRHPRISKGVKLEHKNEYYLVAQDVSALFTGRNDECEVLRKNCLPSPALKVQRRFVLYGLGGSGKTQVALQFAQNHRECFWGVFWIDCSTNQTIVESYLKIARTCHIAEELEAVKSWLTNSSEAWLLILDNADDPALNILGYIPVGSRGTILITTRNPELTSLATVGNSQIASMETGDATTLLLRISDLHETTQEGLTVMARSLVETLGCLALAIVQAGAYIRQKRCTITQYAEMYTLHPQELLSRIHSPAVTDYKYTVYTTWKLSIDTILEINDETSHHAVDLLQLFSFLHFASIPEELFSQAAAGVKRITELAESTTSPQDLWLLGDHSLKWDPSLYRDAIDRLSSFSLITRNKSNTISMHPLVHAWARGRLNEAENIRWSEKAASILAMSIKTDVWGLSCKYRRSIISHIVSSLSHVHSTFFVEGEGIETRLSMIDDFAEAFLENHLLQESASLRKRILDARMAIYARDSLEVLDSIECYTRSLFALGRFEEGVQSLRDVLAKKLTLLGIQDPSVLRCKNILSRGLLALGRYEEALDLQLGIMIERPLKINTEFLQSLEISSRCYILLGRPQEALHTAQELLTLRQRKCGEDPTDLLKAMEIVALSYSEMGRYQDACDLGESIFNMRLNTFGEESRSTLNSMNSLSLCQAELGHYQKACSVGEELVTITTRILGEGHPETITATMRLAAFYHLLGFYQKALSLVERSQELAQMVLGDDHPDTLLSSSQMAGCLTSLGRLQEAEALYQVVIMKQSKTLGSDHKATLHSKLELASLYVDSGRFEESRILSKEVFKKRSTTLGDVHPDTLYAKQIITSAYVGLGHPDSDSMAQQLVKAMSAAIGQDHPYTLSSKQLLAQCCHNSGQRNVAVEYQEAVVASKKKVLGNQHPSTIKAVKHLETFKGRRRLGIGEKARGLLLGVLSTQKIGTRQNSLGDAKSTIVTDASKPPGVEVNQQEGSQRSSQAGADSNGTTNGKPNR